MGAGWGLWLIFHLILKKSYGKKLTQKIETKYSENALDRARVTVQRLPVLKAKIRDKPNSCNNSLQSIVSVCVRWCL